MLIGEAGNDTEANLQALVAAGAPEMQRLEYKSTILLENSHQKDEFRQDVSSFANASGGQILYGIREVAGRAAAIVGMDLDNPDRFKLRLEEILQTHIRPRIPGVRICPIRLTTGRHVVAIHISRSFDSPHQVHIGKDDFRFWSRNSGGKYRLDVDQLRSAFLASDALADRIRSFRAERLGHILAGKTPATVPDTPKSVWHLVPFGAFDNRIAIDLSIARTEASSWRALQTWGWSTRYNLDGLLVSGGSHPDQIANCYCQIYRSGIVEAVDAVGLSGGTKAIDGYRYEDRLLSQLQGLLAVQTVLRVEPPISLMLSFLGVRSFAIVAGNDPLAFSYTTPIDRPDLLLPDVLYDNPGAAVSEFARPILDAFWNAGGWERSPSYGSEGDWTRS